MLAFLERFLPGRSGRPRSRRPGPAGNRFRPGLEPLEERTLLSADWGELTQVFASDPGEGDLLGVDRSIDVSGETFVAGARQDDAACPDDPDCNSGSAYVFLRNGREQAKLTASDAAAGDQFGWDVAIDGDTVVVGARNHDGAGSDSGAVYVFVRSGTTWTQQAKLTASDAAAFDVFGGAVAIDGDTIAVGALGDDDRGSVSGSVYLFRRDDRGTADLLDDTWSQIAKLVASDGSTGDRLGEDVAIDGNTVAAGAIGDNHAGTFSGAAYVFRDTSAGGDWTSFSDTRLTASDAAAGDLFGVPVAISGDTVVVGARADDDGGTTSGAAYVYQDTSGDWTTFTETKLTASDAAEGDFFGFAAGISGDTIVVGAFGQDDSGADSGSVYVFERTGGGWTEVAKVGPSTPSTGDHFGSAVAIDGDTFVVGARFDDIQNVFNSGSAYVFVRSPFASLAEANTAAEALLAEMDGLGLTNGDETSLEAQLEAVLTQLGVEVPQDNSISALLDNFVTAIDRLWDQGDISEQQRDGLVLDALLLRVGFALLLPD
jgi:hypothetical protein